MENNGFLLLFDVKSRNFQLNTIELARLLEEKICAGAPPYLNSIECSLLLGEFYRPFYARSLACIGTSGELQKTIEN